MTTDGTQHYQALSALEGEGIPFQEKTQAMGHNTRRAGTVGAVGERPGASVLYYFYVKRPTWSGPVTPCGRRETGRMYDK